MLNHEQLLLLSILSYAAAEIPARNIRELTEEIRKKYILKEKTPRNPMRTNVKEWELVLETILSDEKLLKYRISNRFQHKGLFCFVAKNRRFFANDVNLIFRGSAESSDWDDNAISTYVSDSPMQKVALKHLKNLPYKKITVSGHSKGGNIAMYLALFSGKISRAVSFDGQGFSKEFFAKYEKEFAKYPGEFFAKITNISAAGDPVHRIMTEIPGSKKILIKTDKQNEQILYHKPIILLDKNGKLRKTTDKELFLNQVFAGFAEGLHMLPKAPRKFLSGKMVKGVKNIIFEDENPSNQA